MKQWFKREWLIGGLVLCGLNAAAGADPTVDGFEAGTYGGLTAGAGNEITFPLVEEHGFDWVWLQHQGTVEPILRGDQRVVEQLRAMSRRARLILRLWPWGSTFSYDSTGIWSLADPALNGKDWLHLADDPALLAASIEAMARQIAVIEEACGPGTLFAATISEEEPDVGMNCGRGIEALQRDPQGSDKLVRVHNAMYAALKQRYPNLPIGVSVYPCGFNGEPGHLRPEQYRQLQRDLVLMDAYPVPGGRTQMVNAWRRVYPPSENVYVLLYGCGSVETLRGGTIEGYSRLGRRQDIDEARADFEAFYQAGYRRIGWFGLGWPNPVRDWVVATVERQSPASAAGDWDATARHAQLARRLERIGQTTAQLPAALRQRVQPGLDDAAAKLHAASEGLTPAASAAVTEALWQAQAAALDEAAEVCRRIEEYGLLMNLQTPWQDPPADNTWDTQARRLIQAQASLFETLPRFFQQADPILLAIERETASLRRRIDATLQHGAATPDNEERRLGERLRQAVDAGDMIAAHEALRQIGPRWVGNGRLQRVLLTVRLLNPYDYPVNAHPAVEVSSDGLTWRRVYRDRPFADSRQREYRVQVYLDDVPAAVRVDNGDWTGWFDVQDLHVVTPHGLRKPIALEPVGQTTVADPPTAIARIPHVGAAYGQDMLVTRFAAE